MACQWAHVHTIGLDGACPHEGRIEEAEREAEQQTASTGRARSLLEHCKDAEMGCGNAVFNILRVRGVSRVSHKFALFVDRSCGIQKASVAHYRFFLHYELCKGLGAQAASRGTQPRAGTPLS